MIKSIFIASCIAVSLPVLGQTELKTSPITLMFGGVMALSTEVGVRDDIGLDGDVFIIPQESPIWHVAAKHYMAPSAKGLDRFHIGLFASLSKGAPGMGFLAGHKIVTRRNLLIEFGLGYGRTYFRQEDYFNSSWYGKMHIGYRFEKDRE